MLVLFTMFSYILNCDEFIIVNIRRALVPREVGYNYNSVPCILSFFLTVGNLGLYSTASVTADHEIASDYRHDVALLGLAYALLFVITNICITTFVLYSS